MTKKSIYKIINRASILLALSVWVLPTVAVAQNYYDPGLLQRAVDRKPTDYIPPGIRMGGFKLNTGAELALEKNDNIFYRNNLEISDTITHVRPWLNLNSDWNRHMMNFSAYADLGYYNDYGSQDYKDWVVNLDGRFDVRYKSAFNYKASYMDLHEDRTSTDRRGNVEPTTFTYSGFDVDYTHTFNRLTAALGYQVQDAAYDSGIDLDGNYIDNQDRDRTRDIWSARLGYDYSEQTQMFIEYADNKVDYDQTFDNSGYSRSSDGYDVRGGLSLEISGVISGDMYLQYISQDYDDPRLRKISGLGLGAGLDWTPTKLTSVRVRVANSPHETTQQGTSGYYSTLYSARVQHELRRDLLLNVRYSYTDNNYEYNGNPTGNLLNTEVTRTGLGMSYLFNRHWYLSGGYIYEKQKSNSALYQYKANRFFVTLGGEL